MNLDNDQENFDENDVQMHKSFDIDHTLQSQKIIEN